jgi:hypothetical protein
MKADAAPALVARLEQLIAKWRETKKAYVEATREANRDGNVELDAYRDGKAMGVSECAHELLVELEAALREGQAAAPAVPADRESYIRHVRGTTQALADRVGSAEVGAGEAAIPARPGEEEFQCAGVAQDKSTRSVNGRMDARLDQGQGTEPVLRSGAAIEAETVPPAPTSAASPGDAALRARLEAVADSWEGQDYGDRTLRLRAEATVRVLRDALAALSGPGQETT